MSPTLVLALLLRPLAALVIAVALLWPIKRAVERWMPECRAKRILLTPLRLDLQARRRGRRR